MGETEESRRGAPEACAGYRKTKTSRIAQFDWLLSSTAIGPSGLPGIGSTIPIPGSHTTLGRTSPVQQLADTGSSAGSDATRSASTITAVVNSTPPIAHVSRIPERVRIIPGTPPISCVRVPRVSPVRIVNISPALFLLRRVLACLDHCVNDLVAHTRFPQRNDVIGRQPEIRIRGFHLTDDYIITHTVLRKRNHIVDGQRRRHQGILFGCRSVPVMDGGIPAHAPGRSEQEGKPCNKQ